MAQRLAPSTSARLVLFVLALLCGSATSVSAQEFRRGDVDGDGVGGTVADLAFYTAYLLTAPFPCRSAADVNDDGQVSIADLVDLVPIVLGDAPPPPAPGIETCGVDPTPDTLSCASYDTCDVPVGLPLSADHTLRAADVVAVIGTDVTVPVHYDNPTDSSTAGITVGLCHDPAVVSLVSVEAGSVYDDFDQFWSLRITPTGWTVLTLTSFFIVGTETDPLDGNDREVAVATYSALTTGTTALTVCDPGVDPAAPVAIGFAEVSFAAGATPTTVDGSITVLDAPVFRRGDVNLDEAFDIADPIALLDALFSGGATPGCTDGADANDDGALDIGDPIALLGALFSGAAPPPAPGPTTCGIDPTADALGCESSCP